MSALGEFAGVLSRRVGGVLGFGLGLERTATMWRERLQFGVDGVDGVHLMFVLRLRAANVGRLR